MLKSRYLESWVSVENLNRSGQRFTGCLNILFRPGSVRDCVVKEECLILDRLSVIPVVCRVTVCSRIS